MVKAHLVGILSQRCRQRARTRADGCADSNTFGSNLEKCCLARAALRPTKTMALRHGNNFKRYFSCSSPSRRWTALSAIVRSHQGITFQSAVASRGIPIILIKQKVFAAVWSSLLRLIKPEPLPDAEVIGPGFSKRNKTSALSPPSSGSKSGTSTPGLSRSLFT